MSQGLTNLISDKFNESQQPITLMSGYTFDMYDTVNRVDNYRLSNFRSGDVDSLGNKKYFFNILNSVSWTSTKSIDLDTKDVNVRALDGKDFLKAKLYQDKLKQWMKENGIGKLFNKISEELPAYGSVVLKKVKGDIHFVPMRDFFVLPGHESVQSSPFTIEQHRMQPDDLKKMSNWDEEAIDEVINSYLSAQDQDNRFISVLEFYGYVPNSQLDEKFWEKDDFAGYTKMMVISAMDLPYKLNDGSDSTQNIVLFQERWKGEYPYKHERYLEVAGRFMGLGVFEMGFDFQERWNEMANQKARSMKLGSRLLFQSRDKLIERNLMTDVEDGDIVKVNSELSRIPTGLQNLGVYSQEESNVIGGLRNLTNAQEIVTGENMPSGTPFRLGALLNTNANKLYEFIQQKLGLFLKDVLMDWIIPEFEKEIDSDFVLEVFDDEVRELVIERDINMRVNQAVKDFVMKSGRFPTEEEIQVTVTQLLDTYQDVKFVDIAKGFLDFDKDLDIVITGEAVNTAQKVESLSNITLLLSQNPGILDNPQTKLLTQMLLEHVGVSPAAIGRVTGGGSISGQVAPTGGEAVPPAQLAQAGGPNLPDTEQIQPL